jgi:beta-N-acetylglucosaminidase
MLDKIQELEDYITENKIAGDHPLFTKMMDLTQTHLDKFETKMIVRNQTLIRRSYTFNHNKTSDEINNLFLRVVASIQQGNSITASVEHNGYNYNKFYSMINDEQRSSLINEKKLATLKKQLN